MRCSNGGIDEMRTSGNAVVDGVRRSEGKAAAGPSEGTVRDDSKDSKAAAGPSEGTARDESAIVV